MSKAVFGIVESETQADKIVSQLKTAGFSNTDISVLFADKGSTRDFAHEKHTKAPEGTATGAATGGVLGGTLGWLAGIGALAIPGLGPFVAAGPIMAALGGAAVGAAAGGLTGLLVGLGIPEFEAKLYEGKLKAGNVLVSVHTEDGEERKRAKDILERAGAQNVSVSGEKGVPDSNVASSRAANVSRETARSADMKNPGSKGHPVGTGLGAAGGAATGAAIGAGVGGPVGMAVGGAVGAVAGAVTGYGVAEAVDPKVEDSYWRENYTNRDYVEAQRPYSDYAPAYRYGWESYQRMNDRRFEDAEGDLEQGWNRVKGQSKLSWNQAKHATRDAWHRVEHVLPGDADNDGR